MSPDQFPILMQSMQSERRRESVANAIVRLDEAERAGSIRKVEYDDAKMTLGRAVEDAWESYVSSAHFHAGRWETQTNAASELYDSIMVMSLHDLLSAAKKIEKCSDQSEPVMRMRELIAEVLPLAKASKELKDKVVKGRVMRETPAPVNPNKIIKTCGCCSRQIALAGSTMAHHGYERPGNGQQTASCPGIRFRPLERSDEGLRYMFGSAKAHLDQLLETQERLRDPKFLYISVSRDPRIPMEKIYPTDQRWNRHLSHLRERIKWEIQGAEREYDRYENAIQNWKATETENGDPIVEPIVQTADREWQETNETAIVRERQR